MTRPLRLLLLAMGLVFSACGDDDQPATPDAAPPAPDGMVPAPDATPPEADATPPSPDATPPPPGAPVLSATSPASPANENAPSVLGTAAASLEIRVYADDACAGAVVATGVSDAAGAFAIAVTVADDTTTTFRATAYDAVGGESACSAAGVTYVEDSTPPALPEILATVPASPSSDATPDVSGTAEASAIVRLYGSASCAGAGLGEAAADAAGAFTVAASLPADVPTTLHATATDAAGNTSGCATGPTYVHDATSPAPPALTGSTPAAPANDNAPTIDGTAEASAVIRLYVGTGCTGAIAAEGAATAGGAFAVTVSVPDDATRTYRATAVDAAGNVSGCSTTFVTYVEDSTAPAPPALLGTAPASGANENAPVVSGTAEAGSTVTIYGGDCAGAPLGAGTATAGGGYAVTIAVVDDTTTTLRATATDGSGNTSACSASAVVYTEDSTAPAPPALTGTTPLSPSGSVTTPLVAGTAEAGATIRLYTSGACAGTPAVLATAGAGGGFTATVGVGTDTTSTIRATAEDGAGNVSSCSAGLDYVHDISPPAPPVLGAMAPAGPANDNAPELSGTAEPNAEIVVYASADCSGAPAGVGVADVGGSFTVTVAAPDDLVTTFTATATDDVGNLSGCSAGVDWEEDSTPPAPPILGATSPVSPVNDNAPTISGSAEVGAVVRLYGDALCAGAEAGAGTATGGAFAVDLTVADNTMTTVHATATDVAGNTSPCSPTFVTYVEQSPGMPTIAGTISYTGPLAGRVYVTVGGSCTGCNRWGGTSLEGPGPYLIRGVDTTGPGNVRAWIDVLGTGPMNLAADPTAEVPHDVTGGTDSGVDLALTGPSPVAPPAPSGVMALPYDHGMLVGWDRIEDAQRHELADRYELFVAATPGAGPTNYLASREVVAGSVDIVSFGPLAYGTYYVAVRASAGGLVGPLSPEGSVVLAAPSGGHAVTGEVAFPGLTATGPLYVVAISEAAFYLTRVDAPVSPQSYTLTNVADGTYEIGAFLDLDADGELDQAEPATFRGEGQRVSVTVAGADAPAAEVTLSSGPVVVAVVTSHDLDYARFSGDVGVTPGAKVPVAVTIAGGPGIAWPRDVAIRDEDRVQFNAWLDLGTTAPAVGAVYVIDVVYADGTTGVATPAITGVLADAPTPLTPVGSSAADPDPLSPWFSWSSPDPAPTGSWTYNVYVWRPGGGWWYPDDLPSSTTGVAYDFDGRATPGESPLLPATEYEWSIAVRDAFGNRASRRATFTTP